MPQFRGTLGAVRRAYLQAILAACVSLVIPTTRSSAQLAYANTEAGRPLRTQDAYAVERFRLDAHLGPVAWRQQKGEQEWLVNPEIVYGLVPRTQVQVALPFGWRTVDHQTSSGLSSIDASVLYNFNVESRSWPALAVRARTLMPVGHYGVENAHTSLTALVTRTFDWGRLNVNHEYTFGDEPGSVSTVTVPTVPVVSRGALSRWWTGASLDRAMPLRGLLASAEVVAREPLESRDAHPEWNLGTGVRYQWTATIVVNAGVSKAVTGSARAWTVTAGIARTTALRALFPGLGRWGGP